MLASSSWLSVNSWGSWLGSFIWKEDLKPLEITTPLFCVVGTPGAGKTSICSRISNDYNFVTVSLSDIAQQSHNTAAVELSDMEATQMTPTPEILTLVREKISQCAILKSPDNAESTSASDKPPYNGILIDGFPDSVESLLVFQQHVCDITGVIYVHCNVETAQERLRTTTSSEVVVSNYNVQVALLNPLLMHFKQTQMPWVQLDTTTNDVDSVYDDVQNWFTQQRVLIDTSQLENLIHGIAKHEDTFDSLLTITKNLVHHFDEARYRTLMMGTPRFQEVIASNQHAMTLLSLYGFTHQKAPPTNEAGESHGVDEKMVITALNKPVVFAAMTLLGLDPFNAPIPTVSSELGSVPKPKVTTTSTTQQLVTPPSSFSAPPANKRAGYSGQPLQQQQSSPTQQLPPLQMQPVVESVPTLDPQNTITSPASVASLPSAPVAAPRLSPGNWRPDGYPGIKAESQLGSYL